MTYISRLKGVKGRILHPNQLIVLEKLVVIIAIATNLTFVTSIRKRNGHTYFDPPSSEILFYTFASILLFLASWIFIITASNRAPLILKNGWNKRITESRRMQVYSHEQSTQEIIPASRLSPSEGRQILRAKGPDAEEFNKAKRRDFGSLVTTLDYYWLSMFMLIEDQTLIYVSVFLAMAICGFSYSPLLFSFHLLEFVRRSPTLQNILRAISLTKNQLGMTALLCFAVIYMYAVVGFTYFQYDYLIKVHNGDMETFCETLWDCYIATLNLGLRMGGGIGDAILVPEFHDNLDHYYARVIFDLTFFIIIILILLNIIFGLIIDTFAELRDRNKRIEQEKKNRCFICSIERPEFDRLSRTGFHQHIKHEHHMWNYIFFMLHLKTKDPTEYDGVESIIADQIKRLDPGWIPSERSLLLEENKEAEGEEPPEESIKINQQLLEALSQALRVQTQKSIFLGETETKP